MEPTLYCEHHGWHPALRVVLERMDLIEGRPEDDEVRRLLVAGGAEETAGHLMGAVPPAVEILRGLEARVLEAAFGD